jgi:hypothetical protein
VITIDASEIRVLEHKLGQAAADMHREAGNEVQKTARQVAAEARGIAGGYPHGTGALAAAVRVTGSGLNATVGADVREAFYLEVGSPNTGAPRPWLSGPAERHQRDLEDQLAKAADPFRR